MIPTKIESKNDLRMIGERLDENHWKMIRILNGGVVVPTDASFHPLSLGTENTDERPGKRRSKARQRKRSTRRERQANRYRQTNRTTQVLKSSFVETYKYELSEIGDYYPGIQFWAYPDGALLLIESSLLRAGSTGAVFIVFIPFVPRIAARGWAFWDSGDWIGPRHTNFPDGSICAFEASDLTWQLGDPIVKLLDLHVLWAVKHLHLKEFGRWPGLQSVHEPYERLTEFQDNEFCGCSNPGENKLYKDCCKNHDASLNKLACAISFAQRIGGVRKPPESIISFQAERTNPPDIESFIHNYTND